MTATMAERSRAKRLRRAMRDGKAISDEDSAWLSEYESSRRSPSTGADVPPSEGVSPAPPAPAAPSDAWVPIPAAPVAAGGEPTPPGAALAPSKCAIPDCPACRAQAIEVPQVCAATGKTVYPPISDTSARFIAQVTFFVLGFAIRILRGASELHMPTALQVNELAKAVKEILRRRAGWVATFDDFLMASGAVVTYSTAAWKAGADKSLPSDGESR